MEIFSDNIILFILKKMDNSKIVKYFSFVVAQALSW